jgi:hypothetical protein
MYGFGVDEIEQGEPQNQNAQDPKGFRKWMDEVSGTLKALKAENESLKESQRQREVAEALTAKGYAPQAAGLFTGTPDRLDDWLGAHGAALAKSDGSAVEPGQGVQGTPQTVVSPESQAALTQMAAAGANESAALSGDDQLVARMNAAQTEEEFNAIMREAGNRRF